MLPLMRVLSGLLAICLASFLVAGIAPGKFANWVSSLGNLISLVFMVILLTLCLYFSMVGRSP